ncbi:unnamed protein product [Linum trigynum]|uniref:Uncharacterized protein n=1 Tax=Linum trigynum TaxID=586398 RepID=A0AAV2EPH0_9ROSI
MTRVGGQLGFAKVCVDLTAECGFPSKVRLYPDDDPFFEVDVDYLNLPRVCSDCQVFGHDCSANALSNKRWVVKGTAKAPEASSEALVFQDVSSVGMQSEIVTVESETGVSADLNSKGKEVADQSLCSG